MEGDGANIEEQSEERRRWREIYGDMVPERIVDTKIGEDGKRYYKVQWAASTMEPAKNFLEAELIIEKYWDPVEKKLKLPTKVKKGVSSVNLKCSQTQGPSSSSDENTSSLQKSCKVKEGMYDAEGGRESSACGDDCIQAKTITQSPLSDETIESNSQLTSLDKNITKEEETTTSEQQEKGTEKNNLRSTVVASGTSRSFENDATRCKRKHELLETRHSREDEDLFTKKLKNE